MEVVNNNIKVKVACKRKEWFNRLLCSAIRWCHLKFQNFTFPVAFHSKAGMGGIIKKFIVYRSWRWKLQYLWFSGLYFFLACCIILGKPEIISNTLVCSGCIMGSCTAWWQPEQPVLVTMGLRVTLWSGKRKTRNSLWYFYNSISWVLELKPWLSADFKCKFHENT